MDISSLVPTLFASLFSIPVPSLLHLALVTFEYLGPPQPFCNKDYLYQNVTDLVRSKGYDLRVYHLRTFDDYRLEIHRLSSRTKSPSKMYPVILHHGLETCSSDWSARNNSLGYRLVNSGYDVWMLNIRGNYYSCYNYKLSTLNPKFWEITMDVVMENDFPQIVSHVLNCTGKSHILYGGFSMGTTLGMGAFSGKLQEKVKAIVLLGPAHTLSYLKGILGLVPKALPVWLFLHGPFVPKSFVNTLLAEGCCYGIGQLIFSLFASALTGDALGSIDRSFIATLLENFPSGIPAKVMGHFAQMRSAGKFQKYDYGEAENLKKYKQATPPLYNIKNLTTDTYLYYALGDLLTGPEEAMETCKSLGNCKGLYRHGNEASGHFAMVYGDNDALNKNITDTFDLYCK